LDGDTIQLQTGCKKSLGLRNVPTDSAGTAIGLR
jgi:hypothetical protein